MYFRLISSIKTLLLGMILVLEISKMATFFQVLRGVFYFSTLVIGVFLLRGDIIFGTEVFKVLREVIMPGYLILCGIMIGYVIAVIWKGKLPQSGEEYIREKIFTKSFIFGIVIGLVLALSYLFF